MTGGSSRRARAPVAQIVAVAITLGAALVVAVFALGRSEQRLSGTNSIPSNPSAVKLRPGQISCQGNLLLPADTAAVELFVGTYGREGTPFELTVRNAKGAILRRGSLTDFRDGDRARIAIPRTGQATSGTQLCVKALMRVSLGGDAGAFAIRFLKPGKQSLAQLAPTIFHRASLFKAGWVGSWTFYVLFCLALIVIAGVAALLLLAGMERLRPRAGIAGVALVAFTCGLLWSLVTPAFQPPDEAAHYAYTETVARKHHAPYTDSAKPAGSYTEEQNLAINYTAIGVVQNFAGRPPWAATQESAFEAELRKLGSHARDGGGGYTSAAGYSPLYYVVDAVPYEAASNASIFTRLWLMRLMSALMAAGVAALAFLFARELAPSVAWVPLVAGLAVACQPMTAFMSGAVNNDALLILLFTLELYLLARALRRGLTVTLAAAIGAALALGITAKPTMYALVPVALGVVIFCLWRDRLGRKQVLRACSAAVGCFIGLLAFRYLVIGGGAGGESIQSGSGQSLTGFLSYTWQWYLPPLPFLHKMFAGTPPVYEIFFKGFWANFGHLDTQFPGWVYRLLALATTAIVMLCACTAWRFRSAATTIVPRVLLCLGAVVCVALLVNLRAYQTFTSNGEVFAQGRYLLPSVAVFGAAIAGAALAFGRQRGLVAATIFVLGIACLNVFSMGLVLTRFYS